MSALPVSSPSTDQPAAADVSPQTSKTVVALEGVFTERLNHLRGEAANHPSAEINAQIAAVEKAQASFHAYQQSVTTKPHASMTFVRQHAKNGYSPKAWTVFITALMLRVLPTTEELLKLDAALRNCTYVGDRIRDNYLDEVGNGKLKSHVQLLFDSVRIMQKNLGLEVAADIETYQLVYQLIKLRKAGVEFKLPENESTVVEKFFHELSEKKTVSDATLDAIVAHRPSEAYQAFCRELSKHSLVVPGSLPGIFQDAGSATLKEQVIKYYGLFGGRLQTSIQLPEPLQTWEAYTSDQHNFISEEPLPKDPAALSAFTAKQVDRIEKINQLADPKTGSLGYSKDPSKFKLPALWREYQFENAMRIAAILPDEIINYREQSSTFANDIHDPAIELLSRLINTQTREGSSAGPASVKAFQELEQSSLGYVPPAQHFRATLWADVHVAPKSGVEERHASDLLELTAETMRYWLERDPSKVSAAFDYVVKRGYPVIDPHHWDSAMAVANAANDQDFIPPRSAAEGWVKWTAQHSATGHQRT